MIETSPFREEEQKQGKRRITTRFVGIPDL